MIGNRADEGIRGVPQHAQEMSGRILVAMATTTRGETAEWMTGDLCARLHIKPRTKERDHLNSSLTFLQRAGLLHFEYDRGSGLPLLWNLTERGIEVARSLPTGVSGAPRHVGERTAHRRP